MSVWIAYLSFTYKHSLSSNLQLLLVLVYRLHIYRWSRRVSAFIHREIRRNQNRILHAVYSQHWHPTDCYHGQGVLRFICTVAKVKQMAGPKTPWFLNRVCYNIHTPLCCLGCWLEACLDPLWQATWLCALSGLPLQRACTLSCLCCSARRGSRSLLTLHLSPAPSFSGHPTEGQTCSFLGLHFSIPLFLRSRPILYFSCRNFHPG